MERPHPPKATCPAEPAANTLKATPHSTRPQHPPLELALTLKRLDQDPLPDDTGVMPFSLAVATTGPVGALSPRFARLAGPWCSGRQRGTGGPTPPHDPNRTETARPRHPHHPQTRRPRTRTRSATHTTRSPLALTHLLQLCSRTRQEPPGRRHLEQRRSQQARTPPLPRPRPSRPERPAAHRIRLQPISRGPPPPPLPTHLETEHQTTRLQRGMLGAHPHDHTADEPINIERPRDPGLIALRKLVNKAFISDEERQGVGTAGRLDRRKGMAGQPVGRPASRPGPPPPT